MAHGEFVDRHEHTSGRISIRKNRDYKKMCILKAEQIYVCSPNGPHTYISAIFSEPISL